MAARSALAVLTALTTLLSGCAAQVDAPSLLPRKEVPVVATDAARPASQPGASVAPPALATLASRLAAAEQAFERSRSGPAAAAASGDRTAAAALTRAEMVAARSVTAAVLADIDALSVSSAVAGADLAALSALQARAAAAVERQSAVIAGR